MVDQGLISLRLAMKQRLLQCHAHRHESIAQVLVGIVYVVTSFFANEFYIFRAPAEPRS